MAYDRHDDVTAYVLEFDDYPGLTVSVRKPGLDGLRAVDAAMPALQVPGVPPRVQLAAFALLADALAESLVDWDLLNSGQPVPATRAGIGRQDPDFLADLFKAWAMVAATPAGAAQQQQQAEAEQVDEPPPVPEIEAELPMEVSAA
jgi:hypothetical protein